MKPPSNKGLLEAAEEFFDFFSCIDKVIGMRWPMPNCTSKNLFDLEKFKESHQERITSVKIS